MGIGAALAGGAIGAIGSIVGGEAAAGGARASARVQKEMYDQTRQDYMPWMEAGERGLGMYEDYMQNWDGPDEFSFEFDQTDPSYQWRLNQGIEATERATAARGGLVSGNRGISLQNYAQNLASTEFQSEFDRALATYEVNQASEFNYMNALKGYAGMGLEAVRGTASAGVPMASGAGSALASAGMGRAAGITGAVNSIGSAMGDYAFGRRYGNGVAGYSTSDVSASGGAYAWEIPTDVTEYYG